MDLLRLKMDRFMLSIYQILFFSMSANNHQGDYSSAKFITS